MQFRFVATGVVLALALAGCQRTSYSPYNDLPSQPAPLQAQPVPSVQGGQLPPPSGASQYPTAPQGNQNMASVDPNAAAPASALDVTKQQMVGNWRVSNGGASCDMFLTLTKLGDIHIAEGGKHERARDGGRSHHQEVGRDALGGQPQPLIA